MRRAAKMVLMIVGGLFGALVFYLSYVAFGPGFAIEAPALAQAARRAPHLDSPAPASRRDVGFEVDGTKLSAWLYLPEDLTTPVPCVVMAHGLGGTREIVLEAYALRFAVVAFARGLVGIDPDKIAVWGTSAGGGYGITLAAEDARLAAVVAHVPGLDPEAAGHATLKRSGAGYMARMFVHGQRDMLRKRLGIAAHRIPLVGAPGSVAMMNTQAAQNFFATTAPQDFVNSACARVILRADFYRPLEQAKDVRCPVLIQVADQDQLAPPEGGVKMAEALGDHAELQRHPVDHFEIYFEEHFERAVGEQIAFLSKHLLGDGTALARGEES